QLRIPPPHHEHRAGERADGRRGPQHRRQRPLLRLGRRDLRPVQGRPPIPATGRRISRYPLRGAAAVDLRVLTFTIDRRPLNMPRLTVELIPDPEQGGFTARIPDIPAYGEGETE